jgi:hypothetical protein
MMPYRPQFQYWLVLGPGGFWLRDSWDNPRRFYSLRAAETERRRIPGSKSVAVGSAVWKRLRGWCR